MKLIQKTHLLLALSLASFITAGQAIAQPTIHYHHYSSTPKKSWGKTFITYGIGALIIYGVYDLVRGGKQTKIILGKIQQLKKHLDTKIEELRSHVSNDGDKTRAHIHDEHTKTRASLHTQLDRIEKQQQEILNQLGCSKSTTHLR